MSNDDGSTDIRIELPLPIDITGTLVNIIGLTWPNAVIKNGSGDSGWRSDNRLVLSIPEKDRHKSAKKAAKYAEQKATIKAETDAYINELSPGSVGLGLPEHLASIQLAMAKVWMEANPEAKNYLESKIYDKETYKSWVFTIAKSEEQTPHALRMKAEERVAELEAELAALKRIKEADDCNTCNELYEHGGGFCDKHGKIQG